MSKVWSFVKKHECKPISKVQDHLLCRLVLSEIMTSTVSQITISTSTDKEKECPEVWTWPEAIIDLQTADATEKLKDASRFYKQVLSISTLREKLFDPSDVLDEVIEIPRYLIQHHQSSFQGESYLTTMTVSCKKLGLLVCTLQKLSLQNMETCMDCTILFHILMVLNQRKVKSVVKMLLVITQTVMLLSMRRMSSYLVHRKHVWGKENTLFYTITIYVSMPCGCGSHVGIFDVIIRRYFWLRLTN